MLELFVGGVTARTAAGLVGVNRHTARLFYHKLRLRIAEQLQKESALGGAVEVDESYFGGTRKGKRGRGAAGKVPVFGILKRGGKVYTQVIPDVSSASLLPILQSRVLPDSVVYSDSWRAYDALDVSEFRHERIHHSQEFVSGTNHINGIENFWNQTKRHLRKYNGIPRSHFHLFLKECEWRFNYGPAPQLLRVLKSWIIFT